MRKIAFYGKGGIGKSTIASSLSYGLSILGYKVMQIGCDPKADSTINLTNGRVVTPVMAYLKEHTICSSLEEIVVEGNNGILCLESGGPTAGLGCAGRGIIATFNVLEDLRAFEVYNPDFVIFDVLGDVVCGGFTMPIRKGFADEVIIITSGEKMSLFAAGNIKRAIDNFSDRNYARLRGLILNRRNIDDEENIVREFARTIKTDIIGDIPRDNHIQFYEQQNKTVIQGNPELPISQTILDIARRIATTERSYEQ
ncbi:MAG: Nitrogenase iron protein 1 [Syntrophorhabdus sp. PtaU1.Bin050]|nr:MAG: Nitrogenase iron protein 1 [Syntrophorhabdus sp. PtaU1.Bin050]